MQMVLLTFDDSVHAKNMEYYNNLFTQKRRNPNGCPIIGTFFVSNEPTDYDKVRELWKKGHEIADHSGVLIELQQYYSCSDHK